jgi:hypothetical protein
MDYRIVEKPAFELAGKGFKFEVSTGEFKDKGRSFFGKYVAAKEYQTVCI